MLNLRWSLIGAPLVVAMVVMMPACKETSPAPRGANTAQAAASQGVSSDPSMGIGESASAVAPADPAASAVQLPASGSAGSALSQGAGQATDQPVDPGQVPPPIVDDEPLPKVTVKKIGLHIGGGPNDDETKKPIIDSIKPHFDEMRGCWRLVQEPGKLNDFGVDLMIEREGGKAQVSNPRSGIKGEGFESCMLKVFEGIEFLKPKTGKTMVSYSVRFTPEK